MKPIILLTAGEPAGIGPDIILQLAQQNLHGRLLCIADTRLLKQRADQLGLGIQIDKIDTVEQTPEHMAGQLSVYHIPLADTCISGQLNVKNADYVLQTLRTAVELISRHQAHALVTGPLHKGIINDAGHAFSGHTEFLAELTQSVPVMMLTADKLRVALATTHLPLKDVSAAITEDSLTQTLNILHQDLRQKFAIQNPRILVCGLNPHAGEGGHLGREEIETIEPVLNKLRNQGMQLTGPLPADTLFTPKYLQDADAVLAMYHDQGLPVLKYVGFGRAINITLGLPIIRTSVDHGTALDLAGTGKASHSSLQAALSLALELASHQHKQEKPRT